MKVLLIKLKIFTNNYIVFNRLKMKLFFHRYIAVIFLFIIHVSFVNKEFVAGTEINISQSFLMEKDEMKEELTVKFVFNKKQIFVRLESNNLINNTSLYSILGKKIKTNIGQHYISYDGLFNGIYIVKVETLQGKSYSRKVIIKN